MEMNNGGKEILLSVISPILNEEFFLPLYLEAVTPYADEILLLDGGSQDNSLEIIEDFQQKKEPALRYWRLPQTGLPYSTEWNEGFRRNFLLSKARGRWILALDVDEFLSDNFSKVFREMIIKDEQSLLIGFSLLCFWGDIFTVRLNVRKDPHWEGVIYRLFRREAAAYDTRGNHCLLIINNQYPAYIEDKRELREVTLYHYHYALGSRIKSNDNRRQDLNCPDGQQKPNFNYRPDTYLIKTSRYRGDHPTTIKKYLKGRLL